MKRIITTTLLILLLLPSVVLAASNIDYAKWFGIITISNNNTAVTEVATTANISTTNFQADNYLNATANNCVMRSSSGADVPFQPGFTDANLWSMWVPSIGANSFLTYILYTADSTGGEIRYFPGAGGMTTTDNETMELGDNFTIEQKGWVDTSAGTDKNLVYKLYAYRTHTEVANTINSSILSSAAPANLTFNPDGEGNETNIASSTEATHWEAINADNDAKYVHTNAVAFERDLYTIPVHTIERGNINSVTIYFRIQISNPASTVFAMPALRTHSTTYDGVEKGEAAGAWSTKNQVYNTNPNTGDAWTWDEIDDLEIGISLKVVGTDAGRCSRVYIDVNYTPEVAVASVTATGVSSGNMTVRTDTYGNVTGGLDFDGDSGDVTVADDAAIQNIFDGGGTIECWINLDSDGENDNGYMLNKVAWTFNPSAEAASKVKIRFVVVFSGDNAIWLTTSTEVDLNTWTHIVLTYDNSATTNDPILYVNGSSVTLTESGTPTGTRTTDVGSDLIIGNRAADDATFDGTIDEVRLYTRILGQTEVTANYDSGVGLKDPSDATSLAGHWHIDMGEGATVYDETANTNDGIITNATWVQGHVPSQFSISINGIQQDGTRDAVVPPNSANWTFVENYSMMYLEYQEFTINGTQAQYIEWEYDSVFHDQSANENDATPTFRTASSDPDVSANMTAFMPIAEAKAPDYVLGQAPPFFTATPNITGNFTTVPPAPAGGFPLAGVIADIANATNTPPQLPLLIIAVFVTLAASLTMSATMRKYGSGTLIVKIIVIVSIMGIFIALKNFGIDFWMLVVFAIIATSLAMASRQLGWQ